MHTIRATCLLQFREFVAELGSMADPILEASGIDPADAGRPDRFIALRSAITAVESAADITNTPDFGRRLALRRGIETIGPLGLAARSAGTFADALDIFIAYVASHSPGLAVSLRPHPDSDLAILDYRFVLDPPPRQRQSIELSLIAILQIFRALLGHAYTPVAVQIPHTALTPMADYVRDYRCTAHFNQHTAGLTLRASDLSRRLKDAGSGHHAAIERLTAITPQRPVSATTSVDELIRTLLPTGALSLAHVATQSGLHPRALQRRLSAEETTFGARVDKARRESAEHLLRDTDISLEHLTRQLGYAEQSVLTHACNRWFGCSPQA